MSIDDDKASFVRRLDEYRGIVFSVANAYCRDPAAREDVVQSIAAELWQAYPRFDGRVRFSTWMYRIAVNTAISYFRREDRHIRVASDYDPATLDSRPSATPCDADAVQRETLDRLIGELDELHRALVLLYLDGNSYADIAGVLGISETNVATKLSRVKQRMKERYRGTR